MATQSERARRNASGLARDIDILEVLAHRDTPAVGLGVVRVAALVGRDKATVSRALTTLADAGLVHRDPETMNYRIGHRVFALAAASAEANLTHEARPYLRQLARHSRETTHLTVLRSGIVLTIISELSPNEVRTASWQGRTSDPLRTPSGRVLVSEWSDAELGDWYAERLAHELVPEPTPPEPPAADLVPPAPAWLESVGGRRPVHDLASLLEECAHIRQRGFTTSDEEFEVGVVAASAPVRDHTGSIIAAINISAPKGRIGGHLDRLGVYVARAADRLSARLGSPRTGAAPA